MLNAEWAGHEGVQERDLYVLGLESPEEFPDRLTLVSPRFVCVIAWDSRNIENVRLYAFVERLLRAGAVYVCAWGPDCERVHDTVDDVHLAANLFSPDTPTLMTTWHSKEPLAETIWYALNCALPSDEYDEGCAAIVGLTIGAPNWFQEIRDAFSDPEKFSAKIP